MNRFFVLKCRPNRVPLWEVIDRMGSRTRSVWTTRERARYVCNYLNDDYLATKHFSGERP